MSSLFKGGITVEILILFGESTEMANVIVSIARGWDSEYMYSNI